MILSLILGICLSMLALLLFRGFQFYHFWVACNHDFEHGKPDHYWWCYLVAFWKGLTSYASFKLIVSGELFKLGESMSDKDLADMDKMIEGLRKFHSQVITDTHELIHYLEQAKLSRKEILDSFIAISLNVKVLIPWQQAQAYADSIKKYADEYLVDHSDYQHINVDTIRPLVAISIIKYMEDLNLRALDILLGEKHYMFVFSNSVFNTFIEIIQEEHGVVK